MTTTIIIQAHCAATKEVVVTSDLGQGVEAISMQDKEELEIYIHDPSHFVKVEEVDKTCSIVFDGESINIPMDRYNELKAEFKN